MVDRAPTRLSLEQLRKQAKELLREYRAGEETARNRFAAASPRPPSPERAMALADAQFVLAREHGFETWASLKRHIEAAGQSRIKPYEQLSEDLVQACAGDVSALDRIQNLLGRSSTMDQLRARVFDRLGAIPERGTPGDLVSLADARLFVARLYGFDQWSDFKASVDQPSERPGSAAHGLSSTPPFYRIDRKDNSIEPRPPLSAHDWEEIFDVMRQSGITGLRAAGWMSDDVLEQVAQLDFLTSLHLEGSRQVTDAGLSHLGRLPNLEYLNLTGCTITDRGLGVLHQLPRLREFHLCHHNGVSDEGLKHLGSCHQLEKVNLLGSNAGDGVIRALAGKPNLRSFISGARTTDAGLPLLHQFPVFKTWQGGTSEFSLMSFQAEPNYLLLRGQITDRGLASLVGLDGLFALNLDDSRLAMSAVGLSPLAALPHLEWLGFDATDETMAAIAALPRLRMLMCQDTKASDTGFTLLSQSHTLEYLWGRRCYNLKGAGFASLAKMPALRGLSVSCKNVDDRALETLPHFPSLLEFMPMDVPDSGFRHVGRCERLEAIWCMYCRETGDDATGHLASLHHLKRYYAGQTRITDRSLEILGRLNSLEELTLSACGGVTNSGVKALAALPRLRELSLESLPGVTREALTSIPDRVHVNFET